MLEAECGANMRDANQADNYKAECFCEASRGERKVPCYFPRAIVSRCRDPGISPRHSSLHSSVKTRPHYSSANVDPAVTCQRLSAEAGFVRSQRFKR